MLGFLFSLIIRVFLVHLNKDVFRQGFFGDSSVHWALVKAIKEDSKFEYVKQYLIGTEPASYPRAFHRYAALFPLDTIREYPWLPNLILFALFGGFSSAYAYHYFSIIDVPPVLGTIWFCVFFVLSVSNLTFDGPAIAYLKLSERLYARLFVAAYFASLAVGMDYNDITSLVIAGISGAVAVTASKFGRQAILFVTPLVAIGTLDWMPMIILAIAVCGGLLLFGNHFVNSIKFQIKHLAVYESKIKNGKIAKNALSNYIDFRYLFGTKFNLGGTILHCLPREPTRAIARYPELVILSILWLTVDFPQQSAVISVFVGSFFIYFITSTKRFSHLGEAYRYLEYNLAFIAPLMLANVFLTNKQVDLLVPGYLVIILILTVVINYFFKSRTYAEEDSLQKFVDKLGLNESDVVVPVSMRLGADICARALCKSFWWQPGNITQSIFKRFIEEYPYLKRDWQPLAKEYGVTHVICDKAALKVIDWEYDFSGLMLAEEDDRYIAYKV